MRHTNERLSPFVRGAFTQQHVDILRARIAALIHAEPHEIHLLGALADSQRPVLFRPTGCEICDFRGYRGRLAIMELLRVDAGIDELIARRATTYEIRSRALMQGFQTLADDGLRRVLSGTTSLEELARVVDLTDRM